MGLTGDSSSTDHAAVFSNPASGAAKLISVISFLVFQVYVGQKHCARDAGKTPIERGTTNRLLLGRCLMVLPRTYLGAHISVQSDHLPSV